MASNTEFEVDWIEGAQGTDPVDDNVDVLVRLQSGQRYTATFFTLENLRRLFAKNRDTGECADGTFMWAANMIIVERLTRDVVNRTIAELLRTGEFEAVFSKVQNES
jgi:hypothetical protein